MAKPVVLSIMAFLFFLGLLVLLAPFSTTELLGVKSIGKDLNATASSDTDAGGEYLIGVGKADITGYAHFDL